MAIHQSARDFFARIRRAVETELLEQGARVARSRDAAPSVEHRLRQALGLDEQYPPRHWTWHDQGEDMPEFTATIDHTALEWLEACVEAGDEVGVRSAYAQLGEGLGLVEVPSLPNPADA